MALFRHTSLTLLLLVPVLVYGADASVTQVVATANRQCLRESSYRLVNKPADSLGIIDIDSQPTTTEESVRLTAGSLGMERILAKIVGPSAPSLRQCLLPYLRKLLSERSEKKFETAAIRPDSPSRAAAKPALHDGPTVAPVPDLGPGGKPALPQTPAAPPPKLLAPPPPFIPPPEVQFPTPSPAPPPPAAANPHDPLAAIDQILKGLELGNIAFNTPQSMGLNDAATIQLKLSVVQSATQLQNLVIAPGNVQSATLQVSDRMEARLSGTNFAITAVTPEIQAVSHDNLTSWEWEVKPKASGRQQLHLTLSALFNVDGHDTAAVLRTFDQVIPVDVALSERISTFLGENWQWLWAAVLVPLVGWIWKRRSMQAKLSNAHDSES